jgi:heme-degrading monooxygenase HmoA
VIVRLWHGRVPSEKAEEYRAFLNSRAIPDYQSVPGNISVHILERHEGAVTHFMTMTFWHSMDAVRGFAGADVETAKYYPEDAAFLLEYEPRVVHYEVVGLGATQTPDHDDG